MAKAAMPRSPPSVEPCCNAIEAEEVADVILAARQPSRNDGAAARSV